MPAAPPPRPPAAAASARSLTAKRRALNRLEAIGLGLARRLFRALGPDRASAWSGRIWRSIAPLTSRHERALTHLQMALPDLAEPERRAIAAAMWDNLGRVFGESFHLDHFWAEPDRVALDGVEAVARIAESGRGGVLVSLHMGNWELATQAAMRLGLEPAGVYQRLRNPEVEETLRGLRGPYYPAGLHAKYRDGRETALKLIGIVRRGGTIAVLGDLRDPGGVPIRFFGIPAHATPFPALVARTLGVPLVVARIRRSEGARFVAEAVEVPVPHTADRLADIAAATQAIHDVYEAWIRADPGQWFWIHRKWAPPAGKR